MSSHTDTPTRRPLVGVSFKMYFDIPKTKAYLDQTISLLSSTHSTPSQPVDIFVIPDFITLTSVSSQIATSSSPLLLGAQDVHSQDSGAFTGEVSPLVLSQAGVKFVEIGHAERRRYFGETDQDVANKAAAISRNNMIPLICIGEVSKPNNINNLSSNDVDKVVEECWRQIQPALQVMENDKHVVLAYEPVWAIGKSEPASPEYVVKITKALRTRYNREYVQTTTNNLDATAKLRSDASLRILYGGSAGPGLFEKIKHGVDGLFLGRFAHNPQAFIDTIKEIAGTN
ncbi:related to triose-phosphate isomerase [Melanopsichium pennsylvanicum]|uniref:Triosephosphate isomerase n=2 Tax=Melanopsichium pennsylvanicum TaxID=63383 RepID=A0AAJ4XSK5_9BASI|nr:related to triose-phosphate isomerase [Melanopsichium pennsylvanicum 4]SNX87161.1 related to triose-phosphate isomerase [Melanopsichium pennsylvanicum]